MHLPKKKDDVMAVSVKKIMLNRWVCAIILENPKALQAQKCWLVMAQKTNYNIL